VAAAWVDVLTGNLKSGAVSILGVTMIKPLLRNSSKDVVMENLTQKERDTLYQIRTFNRYRKTFVVSVIAEYYQILLLLDKAKNAKDYRESLVSLHDLTQKLVTSGRIPKYELERLHQEVLQAHDRYLQYYKQYEYALDQFKLTLSIKASTPLTLDSQEFAALHASKLILPAFSEEEVTGAALARRLDLANISDQVIDAERKIKVAEDQLRAELNLVGGADLVSSKKGDRTGLKSLNSKYSMGLDLNLPFDRMAEATAYRNAQLDLLERRRDYDQSATEIALARPTGNWWKRSSVTSFRPKPWTWPRSIWTIPRSCSDTTGSAHAGSCRPCQTSTPHKTRTPNRSSTSPLRNSNSTETQAS
jgi:hypothetical protein